jgi:subfamily B ATP-binding cassette protein MsbA
MAKRTLPVDSASLPALRRLWQTWVKPHWSSLLVILGLIVLLSGLTSLYPLVIKRAFDAFDQQEKRTVQLIPFIVIAVTAAKGFTLLAQTVMTSRVVTRVQTDMQVALYRHLLQADVAQLARFTPAALTQRFTTDFAYVYEALTRLSTILLRDLGISIGVLAVMFWIDWQVTLVALVVVPLVVPLLARIGKKLRRTALSTQEQMGDLASRITESLGAARIAKSYGLEDYLAERGREAFEEVRRLRLKAATQRARLDPLLEGGGGVAVAGVLVFIGWRIIKGQSTIGDFTGFVTALLLAAQSLRSLGSLNATVQEASSSLERFFAIMDEPPGVVNAPDAKPLVVHRGEVAFEDVAFRYADGPLALRGIDLVVPGGKMTALVGRSGSGKSTLLSLVPRLFDPTAGRVTIDGADIRSVTLETLRRQVALVSQDIVLFDDSVHTNILFGRPGATEDEVVAAAKAAAAHDFIMRLPQGYATRIGDRGSRLSGGERQRLSLARAILKDAPVLLLDEATSSLDSESERAVQTALARLMKGRTALVIAHRLSTVRQADLIVVMDEGRIAQAGTHDELIAAGGIYAMLHRLQAGGGDTSEAAEFGLTRA